MIEFRTMLESDIDAGLALCRSAGWNQLASDWKLFLDLKPGGSLVAIDDSGKVVGTVTTIDYENRFSWIGMVLVDPERKRQGIGTQLLNEALRLLAHIKTVKLDATSAGREVYLKLGFKDEYTLSRMILTEHNNSFPGDDARQMSEEDLKSVSEKDQNVFGASRINLLKELHQTFPDFALTKNNSYCFGRKGYNFSQIGPIVSDTLDDAISLTGSALKRIHGPVVLDASQGSEFYKWLLTIGFTEQRQLIRMYKGSNQNPGLPEYQYAIMGPEFG